MPRILFGNSACGGARATAVWLYYELFLPSLSLFLVYLLYYNPGLIEMIFRPVDFGS